MREKTISIRVNKEMYSFLQQLSIRSKLTISEIVRSILNYFFFAYALGKLKVPMAELMKEFYEKYVKPKETQEPKTR